MYNIKELFYNLYNIEYSYRYYMNWQLIFNFALKCIWI